MQEQKIAQVNGVPRIREGGGIRATKSEYNGSFYTGRSQRRERTLPGSQSDDSTTNLISPERVLACWPAKQHHESKIERHFRLNYSTSSAFVEESFLSVCWLPFGLESSSWGTPALKHLTINSKRHCQMCNWAAATP